MFLLTFTWIFFLKLADILGVFPYVCILCSISYYISLIARLMGPTWGPSGADRTQVGPMLAPWTLLSGMLLCIEYVPLSISVSNVKKITFCYKCINYRLVKHKSCTLLPPDKSQSSFYIPCAIWVFYSINITVILFTSQLLFPLSSLYFGEKLGSR